MFLPVSDQPQNVLFNQLSNFEYLESLTPAPSPHKLTRSARAKSSLTLQRRLLACRNPAGEDLTVGAMDAGGSESRPY